MIRPKVSTGQRSWYATRSAIYIMDDADLDIVQKSAAYYQSAQAGFGQITTEIAKISPFILLRIIINI